MLVHVKTLSLWEAAHYWHDLDPRESTTHQLPLVVRHTLQVLSMWCGKKVAYRVEREKTFKMEILKEAPRFTARHYRQTFKKAIDNKVFGKRFFSNMFISRSQLARLCVTHNEPLPKFWFPDNEKYPYDMDSDLADEVSVGGRYKLILLYDDTAKPSDESVDEQPIAVTVSSNAVKAAQASHATTNAIKDRFIRFFKEEGQNCPSKKAAAEYFFDTLLETREQLLFASKDTAVRTLLAALRSHKKKAK
jgi:hypothetical protein